MHGEALLYHKQFSEKNGVGLFLQENYCDITTDRLNFSQYIFALYVYYCKTIPKIKVFVMVDDTVTAREEM